MSVIVWIVVIAIAIIFIAFGALIGISGYQRRGAAPSETADTSGLGTVEASNLPEPLKNVFLTAGQSTGVPPALLAATSSLECGKLWGVAADTLTQWINSNSNVDRRGCDYGFGAARVWGPMQFLDTTWGLNANDNARAIGCRNPQGDSICAQAGRRTSHIPAFVLNIKDSVSGAGIKHAGTKAGLVKPGGQFEGKGWDDDDLVREIARSYCNGVKNKDDIPTRNCHVGHLGYGQGVLNRYKQFRGELESQTNANP